MAIKQSRFGTLADGQDVTLFEIANGNGYSFRCMDFGATLVGLTAPDRAGRSQELTMCFDKFETYLAGHPFFGSTVGRVANRIGGARYTYKGQTITLQANEHGNMLHSGPKGFHARFWKAQPFERHGQAGVLFNLESPDGDQGFPGRIDATVSLSLTDANELILEYQAESDQPTPFNPTNHAYWNLAGAANRRRRAGESVPGSEVPGGAVGAHEVTIFAGGYLEVDANLVPTGTVIPVDGGAFDFRTAKPISRDIAAAGGYDHCYVLDGVASPLSEHAGLFRAAFVRDPASGRTMDVLTTSPAVQFYTGNMLPHGKDQDGSAFIAHDAICLETQFHPDALNHENFPSIILEPGESFQHRTVHRFAVE